MMYLGMSMYQYRGEIIRRDFGGWVTTRCDLKVYRTLLDAQASIDESREPLVLRELTEEDFE